MSFTTDKTEAFTDADYIFISVNTPTKVTGHGSDKAHDMLYVESAIRDIGNFFNDIELKKTVTVVEKSTVMAGTSVHLYKVIFSTQVKFKSNRENLVILSNPEFMAEGTSVFDIKNPDRVIIGGDYATNPKALASMEVLRDTYAKWINPENIITTDVFSSELSKLASNAFLAQRVSSINSIARICEKLPGCKITDVKKCIGHDSRIGKQYLQPSIGFGGSCLEKDVLALIYLAESLGLQDVADYWQNVINFNGNQMDYFFKKIVRGMFNTLRKKKMCMLGVAFKKGTNDARNSPALYQVMKLLIEGATLNIYDPKVEREHLIDMIQCRYPDFTIPEDRIIICHSAFEAMTGADAIVICTEWEEFKEIDYEKGFEVMNKPAYIFDGRLMVKRKDLEDIGFIVETLGF